MYYEGLEEGLLSLKFWLWLYKGDVEHVNKKSIVLYVGDAVPPLFMWTP